MSQENPFEGPPAGGIQPSPDPSVGGPPAPPPGSGQPPPGYGPPPPAHPGYPPPVPAGPASSNDAVIALVLSIVAWVACPVIPAIVALVYASKAKRAIDSSNGWIQGSGMVTAARVISWINIGFYALLLVGFVIFLIAVAATAGNSKVSVGY